MNLIGAMLHLLAERPDLWRRLREDRTLTAAFVEETLRYASPVQRMPRRTTRPVEIAGVPIAQGEPVVLFFGAANRDPAAFADPDDFRLDRDPREHVAFGSGIHYCVGATLARTEARVALGAQPLGQHQLHLALRFGGLQLGQHRTRQYGQVHGFAAHLGAR